VRVFASCLVLALCAACGQTDQAHRAGAPSESSVQSTHVNPANIDRVQVDLPEGYEVAGLTGRTAPLALWGFGPEWVSEPRQCGALAEPAGEDATVRGWSASSLGGIVYAAVAEAREGLDPGLVGECGTWTLSAGHTSGAVTLVAAPTVDGAATLGMSSDAATSVEGGTETRSHAYTFVAYLRDYVAYVTIVTDPGGAGPGLDADFAAGLLTKTVSALRG
jgi:hypothetical protein